MFENRQVLMAYTKPMVMVFQEYAQTSSKAQSATLSPCIIGPCYHIVDAVEDETLALLGKYDSSIERAFFPNNEPGAKIIEDSVSIRLKAVRAVLVSDVVLAGTSKDNAIVFDDGEFPEDVEIGDYVKISEVSVPESPVRSGREYRVIETNVGTRTLLLNYTLPEGSAFSATIERGIDELLLAADTPGISMDVSGENISMVGLKVRVGSKDCTVSAAEVYLGYKALRQDLSTMGSISDVNEIEGKLGKITPENPLAYGVNVALANTTVAVKFVAVESDDLVGYTAAKDRIELEDPVYAIVPLTQNSGVLSMVKNHCEQLSQPEKGRWRICLGSSPLVTSKKLADGSAKLGRDGSDDFCVLTSATETTFMSGGVAAGDALTLVDGSGIQHTYTVASVVSEDKLTVVQSTPFDEPAFSESGTYAFSITRQLEKLAQAEEIAATSRSFGSSRFVHVWPDVCVIDGVELPGYYLACAVAGGIGGLASHYPFTNLSMSGIEAVKHSGDYFSGEQLDVIAGGGTFIFIQDSSAGVPYVRHQLTTDMSTTEMCELSLVKNFDYVSYCCRDAMAPFIGKYNIVPSTLASCRTSLAATLESLKLDNQPKIGARVLAYSIESVAQLESDRTRIEMYANVTFPYPLNTIGLHIVSQ